MINKLYFTIVFSTIFGILGNAQIKVNQTVGNSSINLSSLFLDATGSTLWNGATVGSTNIGKGFAFPKVDLSILLLTNNGSYLSSNNPNRFDGTVVYNTITSATTASGISVAVSPGFYYFSNPNKSLPNDTTVLGGMWIAMGSNASKNITATEVATAISVDGTPVYAIKGQFTIVINSALTTIVPPTGITGVYRITIFKGTSTLVFSPTVHSFDFSKTTDNMVTGDTMFTQVYPLGTYNYTLEYFK